MRPSVCVTVSGVSARLTCLRLSPFQLHATSLQRTVVEETHEPPVAADPPYAKPVKSRQLDSMLGNLQEDMNKQGVTTTQKGMCGACDKPIVGQVRSRPARGGAPPRRQNTAEALVPVFDVGRLSVCMMSLPV